MADEEDGTTFEPNYKESGTSLYCFLDSARPCSADCMAFQLPEKSPSLSEQASCCVLLVSAERVGRFTGGLVSLLRKKNADEARAKTTAPSSPLGKS